MKYAFISYLIVSFTLVFLSDSCGANRSLKGNSEIEAPVSKPKIVFLNYGISKNTNGEIKVDLINKIVSEGSLKDNASGLGTHDPGDLKCIEIDGSSKAIHSFYIENPLKKNVEYVNPSGQLERKLIELDSAQFSVRLQLKPETKSIVIAKMTDTTNAHVELITSQIN